MVFEEDEQFMRRFGVLIAFPEVEFPVVYEEKDVVVEPEIWQFVEIPPPVCTT
jgi:hypothetical protein